jgi:uncharacterized protein YjiS (DUF1127 family)
MLTKPLHFTAPTGTSLAWGVSAAVRTALDHAATYYARYRQRRALASLSDPMLKDLGLSRGEAYREAAKPFWRA